MFYGIHRCHEVNGVPGLISRGYVYGHGPTYEERRGEDRWFQGKGAFAGYRWRGNPSHHNHSAYFRAMGIAWALVDDEAIRRTVREDCLAIGRYVFLEHEMKVPDVDGKVTCDLMAWPPHDAPSTHGLMVTSALKVIALATQDPDLTAYYERMVKELNYRAFVGKPIEELRDSLVYGGTDHDDGEHAFAHLYNMMLLEEDEELQQFYRNFAEALWLMHQNDKQALYNISYQAVTGNDGKMDDALWWLRHYPTNKYHQPRMNSIRPDIDQVPKPLPLSERPFDNEYDFKGDPYKLDGWLARIVTDVAVSPVDSMVRFACDSGGFLYRSLDGGATWEDMVAGLAGAKALALLASPAKRQIVLAATNEGLRRSEDGGATWRVVLGGNATALRQDPARPNVAYAVADGLVWECVDFDDASYWGRKWRKTGGETPPESLRNVFIVLLDGEVSFFAQDTANALWTSASGAQVWTHLGRPLRGRVVFTDLSASGTTLLATVGTPKALAVSEDGGATWRPCGRKIGWWGEDTGLEHVEVHAAGIDPKDRNTLYAGGTRALHVSRDRGETWAASSNGLAIPAVRAITTCPVTGTVFAGTPGGLCQSTDRAVSWTPGNLVPIFHGVDLVETGPADYLVAYWMARYHGFLSESAATTPHAGS
jgi:photosystem II stability/assembly factor-like uncharacterized protein